MIRMFNLVVVGCCAGLVSVSSAEPITPSRIAFQIEDEQSAAVHLVIDERLDLASRLQHVKAEGPTRPLVPLAPRLVVGQGDSLRNQTFVRVLNEHGIAEAQFLAFHPRLTGGVRVAAGRFPKQGEVSEVVLAATPFSSRGRGEVRLFNEAGGLHAAFTPAVANNKPVLIQAGDFLPGPDHPGDELAVVSERSDAGGATIALHALHGEALKEVSVEMPSGQTLTMSRAVTPENTADLLWLHAAPDHLIYVVNAGDGSIEKRQLPDGLDRDQRVYPTAFGNNRALAVGDELVLSTLTRVEPNGKTAELNAGRLENQFWIFPGDWADKKAGPYIQTGDVYGHFRLDLGNPHVGQPKLWDEPDVWPRIEAESVKKWGPLLRPLNQQPRRMWEPTITHRMNWKPGKPWADRNDPGTGLPRFLALTRDNQSSSYGEFGQANQFHNFTYAYGDTALDQLYAVPLQQFLRRLAVRHRNHPEMIVSLEPVHEHEISVGAKGSVGDYHPLMVAGFHDYLRRLFGDDAALEKTFGIEADKFDAPRNKGRGKWDRYNTANGLYQQWLLYQRYVVNRRIADGYFAALAAGFTPEVVKGHQIPDSFAVGSTETFSERKARFTPVDYALTAGVGFGYTRYGVWFKKDRNMLKGAASSGFQSIAMGEYQSLTPKADLALQQLVHLFENGVSAIHVMHWPASHDKGFNAAMKQAIARLMQEQRPRPGLAGGVGRVVPMVNGDEKYDIAVLGTGSERTGLLKSLRGDGGWQGAVYSVPFRSGIETDKLPAKARRGESGGVQYVVAIDDFEVGEQAAVSLSGSAPAGGGGEAAVIRFEVMRDGVALPGTAGELVCRPESPKNYLITLRNQLPAGSLELAIEVPADFIPTDRMDAWRYTERVARLHRDQYEGQAHRGSIDFAVIPTD